MIKSNSNDLLCHNTVEACAKELDKEAERLENVWKDFIKSGEGGQATDYSSLYRSAAKIVRRLAA